MWKRMTSLGRVSLVLMAVLTIMAVFAPWIGFHPHDLPSGSPLEPPSAAHWLGTDDLGTDVWAQLCHGAKVSLAIGLGTAVLATGLGGLIGILAGYLGGRVDSWLMRLTDIMIALPELPAMIVLGAFFGPSLLHIILVLSLLSWTGPARIIRSRVLSLKSEAYIQVARSWGGGFLYLASRHFIPRIFPLMMVSGIRLAGRAIAAEAGLSFLGLGDPTSKSWGMILHHGLNFRGIYFTNYWKWWVTAPLIAITLVVTSLALLGRDLEKIMDTKM